MSRTLRIYNRIVKKAHRYYVGVDSFMRGLAYHPYRALHMNPKDSCMDQKRQRKVRKEEFTHALDMEVE